MFFPSTSQLLFLVSVYLLSISMSTPLKNARTYTLGEEIQGYWNIDTNSTTVIDLLIPGNPTTGYGWYVKSPERMQRRYITPLNLNKENSTDTYSSRANVNLLGAGGIYDFKFLTISSGNTELVFEYKRPWEREAIRNVTARLTIK